MTNTTHAGTHVVEVGPRDGLQNERTALSVDTKVDFITRAVDAGMRRIEAVSFVNPKRVPQMAGAEEVMAALPRRDDVDYIGLVLNERGLERALAAGVDEVNVVVVCSDEFSQRNQGCDVEEGLARWKRIAAESRAAGMFTTVTFAVSFGCPFSGEMPADRVIDLMARVAESGPDEIAIADTIGVGVPAQVRALHAGARRVAPDVALRWHFHNTRNTGYANALTAFDLGDCALDASIGGFGGCPFAPNATGNIATEDLNYALQRSGVDTGIDGGAIADAASWIGAQLDSPVPALFGRAGPFPG
ncbi:hydroxymethylglutaryl-CoA lyase [Williamsia phyllosphaerae]|uniref:Hydroxymethylglutaryl-CoA lyase n=1 Tax=Williamsia phyllosphaerae TaxID=885042 RepID=A0ABQ1UVX6_9NOCA|nr:hydroxymethylglutaryl-CoA lyase [Williamsia phyllosphaerae]GGF26556.1 hydroxymethylglutaryl-CoA lyase [Williamsia phyllosphaerae]